MAFEGREEPIASNYHSYEDFKEDFNDWEFYISTARESALPVVNAHRIEPGSDWFVESDFIANLRDGESVAIPGWTLVDDFENGWNYRLKRSEPLKNIPETGELFISESERMKEMKTDPTKCIFYSGKLWHSDNTFPVKPDRDDFITTTEGTYEHISAESIYKDYVQEWLSTAYEVVNPEVIPGISNALMTDDLRLFCEQDKVYKYLSDGDQITLPEGYGAIFEDLAEENDQVSRIATITLPKKPYRSPYQFQDCHSFCVNGPNYCNMNHCDENGCNERKREMVEPSESQEEMWMVVCVHSDQIERIGVAKVIRDLMEKFTITRK